MSRLPRELGERVAVHRPTRPFLVWMSLVVVSSPFAILAAVGPPGPVIGVVIFLGFFVPLTYMFAGWFLLEHHIYTHGIVFRSILSLPTYVVPFYTVDPSSLEVTERYLAPEGEFELAKRQQRETPTVKPSINFTGLDPRFARALAKGKVTWDEAGTRTIDDAYGARVAASPQVRWRASFRDPEHHHRLLADTIAASHRSRPYNHS